MKHKRLAAAVLAAALWLTGCGGAASPAAPAGSGAASQSAADTAVQTAQKDRITEQFTLEKTVRNEWGSAQKLTIHVPQLVCDSPDAEYINNELAAMYAAEYRDYESSRKLDQQTLEKLMRTLRRYNLARPVGRLSGLDSRIEVFPTVLLALPDADLADAAAESARTRTELGLYERPEGADTEAGEGEA